MVRHLPSSLTKEEKEDFLRHFGAVRVRVMGSKGPLVSDVIHAGAHTRARTHTHLTKVTCGNVSKFE